MSLTVNTRYEKLANAFENFNGYFAETPAQIKEAFKAALNEKNKPSIINIAINPSADRKAQVNYYNICKQAFFKISIIIFKL